MKPNIVDNVVSFFNPEAGVRRLKARYITEKVRRFDAASKAGRNSGWITSPSDSNSEILPYVAALRNRSRDLVRNNPYADKAIRVLQAHIIGSGIIPQIKATEPKFEKNAKRLDKFLKDWADKTNIDFNKKNNLYSLQSLAIRSAAESGQSFLLRRYVKENGRINLKVQIIEYDHLDITYSDSYPNGNYVKSGVEYNIDGQIVAYHFFREHPGVSYFRQGLIRDRWEEKDVISLYRQDRAGQDIGIPWGTPCLIRVKDFDEYEDAQLVKQKISAMFAGFITSLDSEDDNDDGFDGGKINSGLIKKLPVGTDIKFNSPPATTGYGEFADVSLHAVAIGYGIPYEALVGDYSKVNFSSGKMSWNAFYKEVKTWQDNMVILQFCHRIEKWFYEWSELLNEPTLGTYCAWIAPAREMIDPIKETKALKDQVRSGFKTLSKAIVELGGDPDEHFLEIQSDNKKIDDLSLTLDSDPRKIGVQGNLQIEDNSQKGN
jgi:lambda family phage portal protein